MQAQSDRREMKVERQRYKTGVIIPQLCNLAGGLPQQIEEDVQGELRLEPGLVADLFLLELPLCVASALEPRASAGQRK